MYKVIDGGVCAAKGYKANGLNCGLNKNPDKNDLGLYVSDVPAKTAGVYTTNKVKGAPILVTKAHLEATGGVARAVIMNSKNANTCNADGVEKAEAMCELAAKELGIASDEVLVASTGVIGQILPIEPIAENVGALAQGITYDGNERAATAIMTTDTVKKEYAVEFELDGKVCRLGGMAKGSGMIHPNMATTLNFITTDASVSADMLQKALSEIVKVTYNCLSVDGDTSTNDMVCIMANGKAENTIIDCENEAFEIFKAALMEVSVKLSRKIAGDGEGAERLLECTVKNAPDILIAKNIAKSIICSSLVKTAMFGSDANWGRILCAIGYTPGDFRVDTIDVTLSSCKGSVKVCENGFGIEFSEEKAKEILLEDEIKLDIDMKQGSADATAWGCDLTYDYVKINGDYRT